MGNAQAGPVYRRDRRREITFLFYFVFGFVLIRVWILLIESNNPIVESIGGIITFLLILSIVLRYRMTRDQHQEGEGNAQQQDVNNPDLALLHALFRPPMRGLSSEIINSLHCFYYKDEKEDTNERAEDGDIESQRSSHYMADTESADTATSCSICLSEYVRNEQILMLPCRHIYHRACVAEWLRAHSQCPLCKQDVVELLDQRAYVQAQMDRLRSSTSSTRREEHIVYDEDPPFLPSTEVGVEAEASVIGIGSAAPVRTRSSPALTLGAEQVMVSVVGEVSSTGLAVAVGQTRTDSDGGEV